MHAPLTQNTSSGNLPDTNTHWRAQGFMAEDAQGDMSPAPSASSMSPFAQ